MFRSVAALVQYYARSPYMVDFSGHPRKLLDTARTPDYPAAIHKRIRRAGSRAVELLRKVPVFKWLLSQSSHDRYRAVYGNAVVNASALRIIPFLFAGARHSSL